MTRQTKTGDRREVITTCSFDCGGRCLLKVRLEGGRITSISTDSRPGPGLKACPRGLNQHHVASAPDRLTHPLLRHGPRGEGKFREVSWEEAFDRLCAELTRVKEQHGPSAVLLMDYFGNSALLHNTLRTARRFFSLWGGCTTAWGSASAEAAAFASKATLGSVKTGGTADNLLRAELIILWGFNPSVSRFGPQTMAYLRQARDKGVPIIGLDPRRNPSFTALGAQWIPLRPGTDTALLLAMAQVILEEGLQDDSFVETHTVGLDKLTAYLSGREDDQAKTPAWAEGITGVPAAATVELARAYASAKPACLWASWAPGRTAYGEQYHRAALTLAALTGNIGVEGGWISGGMGLLPMGYLRGGLDVAQTQGPSLHVTELYDALLRGKAGGHPADLKLLYVVGCNMLNQWLNLNKGLAALKRPEFIVVHELFLTPTARQADLVLPVTHFLENWDLGEPWGGGAYNIMAHRVLEPPKDVRSDLAIFTELAARLGVEGYNDKTDQEWLREWVDQAPHLPSYEELKAKGVVELGLDGPHVPFREQIRDPKNHPFPTPSGKIEIESSLIKKMNRPDLPAIPKYLEPWEGPGDPLRGKYPLQFVSPHSRGRVNSTLDNIPQLKRLADDRLWINPKDAATRGIADGEAVMVFNDRGRLTAPARVTDRIMAGVVSLEAGAWHRPDQEGVDRGGCVNVLTLDRRSPVGAFPSNTCLVNVAKA